MQSDSRVCGRPAEAITQYCHLLYWKLVKKYLHEDVLQRIMQGFNSKHVVTTLYSETESWGPMDEKEFNLPVDVDNIPAGVVAHAQTSGMLHYLVEKVREWNTKDKPESYTKKHKKIWLWKLKAHVATSLCYAAQKELRAIGGV